MKTIIILAGLLACVPSIGLALTRGGLFGSFTIAAKLTVEDEAKYTESKPQSEHDEAIDLGQSSSYQESWGTRTLKVGNREVLTAMFGENIKGWSLVYVSGEFSGLVAYKKGVPAVAVPDELLNFGLTDRFSGVSSGKFRETFSAPKQTLTGLVSENYTRMAGNLSLFDLELVGLDKGHETEKWSVSEFSERVSVSLSGKMTLFGAPFEGDYFPVIAECTMSYSLKGPGDVSAYIPEGSPILR